MGRKYITHLMENDSEEHWFVTIVRFLLILLFAYTATSKIIGHHRFIFQMELAPVPFIKSVAPLLGWVIPIIELLIVSGLLTKRFRLPGLLASLFLLIVFEIYITAMLLSGSHLPCTCGGIVSQMGWKQHLIFNAIFIVGGVLSIKFLRKEMTSAPDGDDDEYKILSRA